jgi:hypothetical protein
MQATATYARREVPVVKFQVNATIDSKRYTGEFPLPDLKIVKAAPTPSFRPLCSIHIKGKP